MTCGIYKITNTVNGWVYIGSSINIEKRWSLHRAQLKGNRHDNSFFQYDVNECGGVDILKFEILEKVRLEYKRIHRREVYWTEWARDNTPGCYNQGNTRPSPEIARIPRIGSAADYSQWEKDVNDPDYVNTIRYILQNIPGVVDAAIAGGCSEAMLKNFRNSDFGTSFRTWSILDKALKPFVGDWSMARAKAIEMGYKGRTNHKSYQSGTRVPGIGKRFGPPPLSADKKRKKMAITLPPRLNAWIRSQEKSISELIETALVGHYGLKKPEGKAE